MAQTAQYRCPLSNVQYRGTCPIKRCPANSGGAGSGCFHEQIGYKNEYGAVEICHVFDIGPRNLKKEAESGLASIQHVVQIREVLKQVRESEYRHCERCGVVEQTAQCSGEQCGHRQKVFHWIVKHFPGNLAPLNFAMSDLWRIYKRFGAVRVAELFRLTEKQTRSLKNLTPSI